ncbi:MAG: hypothetical protein AAF661_06600 [Pseudomonadota bacterium]
MTTAFNKTALALCALVGTAACAQTDATPTPPDATASCPVIDSRDWRAWVDAEAGGSRVLRVSGEVDLPTPGYSAAWRLGPADRRAPPAQFLDLAFAAPDGIVAQVVTSTQVSYQGDAVYPAYRAIRIRCGDRVLAEITEIPEAL